MSSLKKFLLVAVLTSVAAAPLAQAVGAALDRATPDCERIYIGTHEQGGMPSLFTARFNAKDGSFSAAAGVASIERPTWLVKDAARPVVYAVSEIGNDGASQGKVYSLRIDPDTGALAEISSVGSGGGGPTHLALDSRSHSLLVANFGTGQVAALQIDDGNNLLGPASVVNDAGSGPTARQRGPHAHGVVIDPAGRFALVPDLGADRLFVYRFDGARRILSPAAVPFVQLPAGTGPRHLVFSPDGSYAYLLAELTGDLYVYAWDAGRGTLQTVQTLSTLAVHYQGQISAGEIIISNHGKRLYVSNRGDDTIVVYQVAPRTGRLTELQRLPSVGINPWHLVLSPAQQWLLAANEASNAVASFRVGTDGRLAATNNRLSVAKPVNIVFAGSCAIR